MSEFKDYLRANVLTILFDKAFLSGERSGRIARKLLLFFGIFWLIKTVTMTVFSILFFPWNRASDKTFRMLKKVKNEIVASGKSVSSLQKNMDWMDERWHYLCVSNGRGRNGIMEVLFFVHAKSGRIRIFVHPEQHDLLELTWGDLRSLAGIHEGSDLEIRNLSRIYQKLHLNIL